MIDKHQKEIDHWNKIGVIMQGMEHKVKVHKSDTVEGKETTTGTSKEKVEQPPPYISPSLTPSAPASTTTGLAMPIYHINEGFLEVAAAQPNRTQTQKELYPEEDLKQMQTAKTEPTHNPEARCVSTGFPEAWRLVRGGEGTTQRTSIPG